MKGNLLYVVSVGLMTVLFSAFVFGQGNRRTITADSSLYVISAKAGGVNFVEGTVSVVRKHGKSGYLLKGDELAIGDKVSTGANGKAEILLNPGSFVRLAENSTFEFTTTSLEDLQLKLSGGSAMFEVITDNDFTFAVNTPKAKFYIVKSGIYRVDVVKDGADTLAVWKGKAQIGDGEVAEVKGGRQAIVDGSRVAVSKFDRDDKDALEMFSKSRAKKLAKVNARLQSGAMRASLLNSFSRRAWNMNGSYGLWVFDAMYGSYCFLPFGYGWNSPYGYYYPRDIWHYDLPPTIYNPTYPTNPTNPTNPNDPTPRVTSVGAGINPRVRHPRADRDEELPFEKIQRNNGQMPVDRQVDLMPSPAMMPSSPMPSSPVPVVMSPGTSAPVKKGDN